MRSRRKVLPSRLELPGISRTREEEGNIQVSKILHTFQNGRENKVDKFCSAERGKGEK